MQLRHQDRMAKKRYHSVGPKNTILNVGAQVGRDVAFFPDEILNWAVRCESWVNSCSSRVWPFRPTQRPWR